MRTLHCPICADKIEWTPTNFVCEQNDRLSPRLGNEIRHAVYALPAPTTPSRAPGLAPFLWCPNCTAELEDYDDRQRKLKCGACGLTLKAVDYAELMEVKARAKNDPHRG